VGHACPVLTEGVLHIGASDDYRYALNVGTGKVLWRYKSNGQVSSPSATRSSSPSTICSPGGEPYHELGAQYFDEHERDHIQRRLVRRLERLGFAVTLEALPAPS
jgi:PQQ enzyme repeat